MEDGMNNEQANAACKALSEWLKKTKDFGKSPAKIETTHDFVMDGLTYYVIRYKKTALGKWFIGVAGGYEGNSLENCGHVFTGMRDLYDEKTALDFGQRMAAFIRDFNAREQMKAAVNTLFKKNQAYVQSMTLDADKIDRQFVKNVTRNFLEVGKVDITSNHVVVADPLCYIAMGKFMPTLEQEIPNGTYPAEVSICRSHITGIRICTARLKIKDTKAVRYELAKPVPETAANVSKDGTVWTGYPVDAGMTCFIDAKGADKMGEWIDKWHKANPDKNHYDDYFAAILAESYKKLPAFQREGGDFTEWTNSDTNEKMVMISSGFGDGYYQCFWGYDESGEICELVTPLVDPDLFDKSEIGAE